MSAGLGERYQARSSKFNTALQKTKSKESQTALLRAVAFISVVVLVIIFIRTSWVLGVVLPLFLLGAFIYLIQFSGKLKARVVHLKNLIQINEEEQLALKGDFSAFKAGDAYIDYQHPYSYDLDVFGDHSLYRMLDRTGTVPGEEQLAKQLMQYETDRLRILDRQEAVRELADQLDWRQQFQATARQIEFEKDETRELIKWLDGKDYFLGRSLYPVLFVLIPVFSVVIPVLIGFNLLPIFTILYYVLPLALVAFQAKRILNEQNRVGRFVKLFKKYAGLLLLLEEPEFKSKHLMSLQTELVHKDQSASKIVNRLSSILWGLESRNNLLMAFLLNAFMVWDLHYMVRLEIWRRDFGKEFDQWLSVIGRIEVLNCLANLHYNRPDLVFPHLPDGNCVVQMEAGGHVLIEPKTRVDNDLAFTDEGQIKIITGANMAGKSTLLRTVGINLLLGMLGAPVCAKNFTFTPMRMRTSVRTNDSLGDNESYFYAELIKLQRIMDDLKNEETLFVIVDEMLKGTNSRDKHTGSVGLVKQLINRGAIGLVATHDVELGQLIREYPNQIENKCFEVEITEDKLMFDYTLREGISKNLNATFLMKQMGIME